MGDRVGQTVNGVTTHFALDVHGLPEVIFTSAGHSYLHLPGVTLTEKGGETRYLLSDGLGSIRHVTDEAGIVVGSQEFDPYGNPLASGGEPYGYTGEWWSADVGLLHLRARWYDPASGTFLSRDAVESEPPYQYVRGNVVNLVDPSGFVSPLGYIDLINGLIATFGIGAYGFPDYPATRSEGSAGNWVRSIDRAAEYLGLSGLEYLPFTWYEKEGLRPN